MCIENSFGVTVVTWTMDISMFKKILSSAQSNLLIFSSEQFYEVPTLFTLAMAARPNGPAKWILSSALDHFALLQLSKCLLTTIIQCMISNVGFGLLTEAHTSSLYHSGDGILFLCLFLGLFGSDPHRS